MHAVSQKAEVSSRIVERSKRVTGSESDVQSLPQVRMQRVVVRRANLAPAVQPAGAVQLGKQASGPPPQGLEALRPLSPGPESLKQRPQGPFASKGVIPFTMTSATATGQDDLQIARPSA